MKATTKLENITIQAASARANRAGASALGSTSSIHKPRNSHNGYPHMAMVPRPLIADSAITVAAGPNANSVTMRRSNASAPLISPAEGEGGGAKRGRVGELLN